MAVRIPPLNPLRNFEAAARLESFRRAAQELCVTEAAVSRQIKALEDHFGIPLFHRGDRRVTLTDAGNRLFPIVSEMFSNLRRAATDMADAGQTLRLYTTTSFALCWLMDKLPDFESSEPGCSIDLQTGTVLNLEFMTSDEIDVSIIYLFEAPVDSARMVHLVDEMLVPVCSPALLRRGRHMRMEELAAQRLLFNEPSGRDWKRWAAAVAPGVFGWTHPIRLDSDSAAIQAAVQGHGIALANLLFVQRELADGRLVQALDCAPLRVGAHYLFCRRSDTLASPKVAAFQTWLRAGLSHATSSAGEAPAPAARRTTRRDAA